MWEQPQAIRKDATDVTSSPIGWGCSHVSSDDIEKTVCILPLQTIYKSRGGVLLDGAKMESVETGDIVSVRTTRGTFRARSVILAGGPWMKKITKDLGLELPLKVQ